MWHKLRARWAASPDIWGFWIDWYEGLLEGRAPDWELWHDVALIEDEVWKAGPEAVAREIELVSAALVAKRLPLAEDIVVDPATGLFNVRARPIAKPDLLGATLGQIADALEDVLADPSNGLRETSADTRRLRRTLTRYANDPQRIEMDLTTAYGSITRQIAVEDLPASDTNMALLASLQEGALGIRATDAQVAENRRLLQGQAFREMDAAGREALRAAAPVLEAITEGRLAEEMREDIAVLVERPAWPALPGVTRDKDAMVPGQDEMVRVFGRAARMAVMIRRTPEIIHRIDGSAPYKGARIIVTLGGLVSIGYVVASIL